MNTVLQPVIGILLLLGASVLWVTAAQLRRAYPKIRAGLLQVPLRDGRLEPDSSRALPGVLRSGPIMTRSGEVVTTYVLSDDAIRMSR